MRCRPACSGVIINDEYIAPCPDCFVDPGQRFWIAICTQCGKQFVNRVKGTLCCSDGCRWLKQSHDRRTRVRRRKKKVVEPYKTERSIELMERLRGRSAAPVVDDKPKPKPKKKTPSKKNSGPAIKVDVVKRCETCRHGIKSEASASGWECKLQCAGSCKPWTPAPRFWMRK